jgi:hypothetical protein
MSCVSRRQGRMAWCLPARIATRELAETFVRVLGSGSSSNACPVVVGITVLARSTPQARGAPLRYAPAGDSRLRAVIP